MIYIEGTRLGGYRLWFGGRLVFVTNSLLVALGWLRIAAERTSRRRLR